MLVLDEAVGQQCCFEMLLDLLLLLKPHASSVLKSAFCKTVELNYLAGQSSFPLGHSWQLRLAAALQCLIKPQSFTSPPTRESFLERDSTRQLLRLVPLLPYYQ